MNDPEKDQAQFSKNRAYKPSKIKKQHLGDLLVALFHQPKATSNLIIIPS